MAILNISGYPRLLSFPLTGSIAILAIVLCLLAGCRGTLNTGDIAAPQAGETDDQPVVTAVMPTAAKAGAEVILFGHGFGTEVDAVDVRFGDVPGTVETVSDTELTVQVPLDAGDGLAVNIDGESVEVLAQFQYIVEELTAEGLAPAEGPEGTEVVITGAGFGTRTEWVSVNFNGTAAEIISLASEELRTAVPAGAASGPVTVARGVQSVELPGGFTVTVPQPPADPPQIDSFSPAEVYPLDEVRIAGADFGTDLANTRVYVGTVEARVVALADTEIVIRPVPGTVDAAIRVENSAGEGTSTGELKITPYPEYFSSITGISTLRLGPGGIATLTLEFNPQNEGTGAVVIAGKEVTILTSKADGEETGWVSLLPTDTDEGIHYLGLKNMLKYEDKPSGMEDEDAWVTCYYEQPVEVTTAGMQPPVTTGLAPDVIYGSHILADDAVAAFESVDYNSPMAFLADGEFIDYYEPSEFTMEWIAECGGIPVSFNSPPPGLVEPGEHTFMAASAEGYSIAEPGYNVATLDSVEIRVDSVSPSPARIGDVVTLTGKNLHWREPGSYELAPTQIRVGGQPVLQIPAEFFCDTGIMDETKFIVMAETPDGEIEVDIQEMGGWNAGQVERILSTGLSLTVDRGNLAAYERSYLPKDSLDLETSYYFQSPESAGLADSGELYYGCVYRTDDSSRLDLMQYAAGSNICLGTIDEGPDVLSGHTGGLGAVFTPLETQVLPDDSVQLVYRVEQYGSSVFDILYLAMRRAVWDETDTTVHAYTLYNSETGEGSAQAHWGTTLATDSDSGYWMICNGGLLHCTEAGWELVEAKPELTHVDPVYGDQPINLSDPLHAEADGTLKVFGNVFYPEGTEGHEYLDLMATYLVTRSADGVWETRQLLGEMLHPRARAFDRESRARLFTNDDEQIYIHREENDFEREEWLAIPYPVGMMKPTGLDYFGGFNTKLKLHIEYDYANLAVGTLGTRFAPEWPQAYSAAHNSGAACVQFLLREDAGGDVHTWPVAASPLAAEKVSRISLEGVYTDLATGAYMLVSPSGTKLMLQGHRVEYAVDGSRNTSTTPGMTMYTLDL